MHTQKQADDVVRVLRSRLRPIKLAARSLIRRDEVFIQAQREERYRRIQSRAGKSPWLVGRNAVALAWWRGVPNFGDELAPLILRGLTNYDPRWVSPTFRQKVITVGSVLAQVQAGDIVVGAGLLDPNPMSMPKNARVIALRGPLSAELVGVDPSQVILGDPGLLAAGVLGVERNPTADKVGVIPHYEHKEAVVDLLRRNGRNNHLLIDVQSGPRAVIEAVAQTRAVVSTSLHGLIVAESLGVPAVWAKMPAALRGGQFKFNDYFLGTGRAEGRPAGFRDAFEQASESSLEAGFTPDTTELKSAFQSLAELLRGEDPGTQSHRST